MIQDLMLFRGPSPDDLWVSDGTVVGTREISAIGNPFLGGLNPRFLTAVNGVAYFNGVETINGGLPTISKPGLWVTDGTAAGTHEITGIAGVAALGLDPFHVTAYNSSIIFRGNSSDHPGLWISDGTAAGTHQITPVTGAFSGGLLASAAATLSPTPRSPFPQVTRIRLRHR
jgi:hypothetical protein